MNYSYVTTIVVPSTAVPHHAHFRINN